MIVQVVCRVLRQIAMASQGENGFNFDYFQKRLNLEPFNPAQFAMLETRLELLKDFVQPHTDPKLLNNPSIKPQFAKSNKGKEQERIWENNEHHKRQAAMVMEDSWSFKPGSLTIVVSGLFASAFEFEAANQEPSLPERALLRAFRTCVNYENFR